jgi:hypothetical protein
MITTTQFNDLVKNAKVTWRKGYDMVPAAARKLYDVYSVSEMTSEHSQIDGPGFAKRKAQGDRYTVGSPKQGYSITLSQLRIGLMEEVTWEMRKFDKYREIERKMRNLGESTAQRMELDLTHQFTFGLAGATSYTNQDGETVYTTVGDGLSIFSTVHKITGSSETFSNLITASFSRTGLEAAEQLFTRMFNNSGVKVVVRPNTIITGDDPATVNAVREFIESQGAPDKAENADNVYKNKYQHLILPYLATTATGANDTTKSGYWMLADIAHTDAICEVSENPTFTAPKIGGNGEDFETDGWKFKSSACYDFGILDPKWIVGSNASA